MIKNNIKIVIAFVAFIVVIVSGGIVNASDLNFDADTVVTINSKNYTILSGSKATTMDIGATTLAVTVPAAQVFTLVSYSGYSFGAAVTQSCSANTNVLTIAAGTTVTITPNSSLIVCSVSGSGSSGGGGGSTTPVADTTPPTSTSIVISGGVTSVTTTAVTLTLGATGATQMMVSNDSLFTGAVWETYATSKSWTLTTGNGVKTVYAKFRDAALNVSLVVSDTITYSAGTTTITPITTIPGLNLPYANAITPTEIAANRTALISYIVNLLQARQTTTITTVSGIPVGFKFTTTLKQGMVSNDVKYLQIFLNSDSVTSIGNSGRETTYFGLMTKAAVGKFQIKYGLVSGSSDAGYGLVGPKTRTKINSLLGI